MEYIYGSGLLFAAFLLLAATRFYLDNHAGETMRTIFGPAEIVALFVTAVWALSLALFADKLLTDWSLVSAGELAVAFGATIAACIAAWRAMALKYGSSDEVVDSRGPSAPLDPRRGRPTMAGGRQAAGAATRKRAA